ncbi:MAG: redoxin domain-containing protein [Marinifilaceae bacterium]|jgi:peroxiredoxin|nr:redoxin domain-containing protein [Marinifilaceae bacterium]
MKKFILLAFLFGSIFTYAQPKESKLKLGDKAPMFKGLDQNGNMIDSKELLKKDKSILLVFYRGQWCPYCTQHLSEINSNIDKISKKASIIAVSPDNSKNIDKSKEKLANNFHLVSDTKNLIMSKYNVDYIVDKKTVDKYDNYGIKLGTSDKSKPAILPVPSIFIIDKSGIIKYIYYNVDYTKRADIKDILKNL